MSPTSYRTAPPRGRKSSVAGIWGVARTQTGRVLIDSTDALEDRMGRRMLAALVLFAAMGLGAAPRTWTPEKWFDKPKSPRIANYKIDAVLDFEHKTLEATETLSWRNTGTAPTQELPLHLYLNAFKGPQSLFVQESGGRLRRDHQDRPSEPSSW